MRPHKDKIHLMLQSSEKASVDLACDILSDFPFDLVTEKAADLIKKVQEKPRVKTLLEKVMSEYQLDSAEGITLMNLAEALLRIPDKETMDDLIVDKITASNWTKDHADITVKFGSMGLQLAKTFLGNDQNVFNRMLGKLSRPSIRHVMTGVMSQFAENFVFSDNLPNALKRSKPFTDQGYWFSYDMLGEAAVNQHDADIFFKNYLQAIEALAEPDNTDKIQFRPSVSVKLSAICPLFETRYWALSYPYLLEKLKKLLLASHRGRVQLMIDAEETWRHELLHAVTQALFNDPDTAHIEGFGLVIQSYRLGAIDDCHWAVRVAQKAKKTLYVRLVKGAYWDTEIKHAQQQGLNHYPVFTRTEHTSINYIACAKILADAGDAIFPQFATHNPLTITAVMHLMGTRRDYELQCIHGMNHQVQDYLLLETGGAVRSRIYAPVGPKKELLAYLVRRMLENGATSSFVYQSLRDDFDQSNLALNPMKKIAVTGGQLHNKINLPVDLYPDRINSLGPDLGHLPTLEHLQEHAQTWKCSDWGNQTRQSPINPEITMSKVTLHSQQDVSDMIDATVAYWPQWQQKSVDDRALILEKAALIIQEDLQPWISQLCIEGGKTFDDAVSEVRETIDFFNYYAAQAKQSLKSEHMVGPTGEQNVLSYHGRGVIGCISPWNFPMAIFAGQIAAALVTGNCVIAKPAHQTPTISHMLVTCLRQAGLPPQALALVIGPHGPYIVSHDKIKDVCLTGSNATAKAIQKSFAQCPGPIKQLIAETGGLNVMIADSSALTEQLIKDVVSSAFRSAGQRCSALRVLYLPVAQYDHYLKTLIGAMKLLHIGDPRDPMTDVGPLIDSQALSQMKEHQKWLESKEAVLYQCAIPTSLNGHYFAPLIARIERLDELKEEVFGPILHVITYQPRDLDQILQDINRSGFGLTMGIQSRIDSFATHIINRTHIGNTYINRDMIGATVGVQPFGGHGASGTGPKAGGPNMLRRLSDEKCVTTNISATGGNISLYNLLAE